MILQCNPNAGYLAHKQEIDAAIARVLAGGIYILGKEVDAFEREFAAWLGVAHAIGVGNGTDAVEMALRVAGIGHGDLVATVSHTAVATVAAIRRCGGEPRFVDIEPEYFTMSVTSLVEVLERCPALKAVVVVHLYGQMADMPAILEVAENHKFAVIEDCAQAHGATLNGKKAGTWGDFGCFSFYPTKNLGAFGDGGAVVTNTRSISARLLALRQYGWDDKRVSQFDGVNSRLDEMQAAILRTRLRYLDEGNAGRRRIAEMYRDGFTSSPGITLPEERTGARHVYHQFVVRSQQRDGLYGAMQKAGVGCAIHYQKAAHQQPAYADAVYAPVALHATEKVVADILSLPMYPELPLPEVERVKRAVTEFV